MKELLQSACLLCMAAPFLYLANIEAALMAMCLGLIMLVGAGIGKLFEMI
jgi:hypothetical protein